MFASKSLARTATIVTALILALSGVQPAFADAPVNDNFTNATIILSLPFSDIVDNNEATVEPEEPQYGSYSPWTVWYSYTSTADAVLRADMAGSPSGDTNLTVYFVGGPGFDGLNYLGNMSWGGSVTFSVLAGATYYFQAGSIYNVGELHFNLQEIPPPANDDFANAALITSLPFDDYVDIAAATIQADEPKPSCQWDTMEKTIWYAFTPAASGSISAYIPNSSFPPALAAYTGSSLNSLLEVGCRDWGWRLTFRAEAGTTYYFQVSKLYSGDQGGSMQFHLEEPPPPVAGLGFYPSDPSLFDTLQFYDQSYDPGSAGFQSFAWDFGDGTTSTDQNPAYRYTQDGDYTVQHSVTTSDGRSASTSQVVQVRTHDVAIANVSAPRSASSGQTRSITVSLYNKRYPETIQIELYKSVPGGFQWIGSYTQFVPVRSGNRTSTFTFNYTFTKDDASIGKVTFKAVATIVNARDALPADNEAISSPPTKIAR